MTCHNLHQTLVQPAVTPTQSPSDVELLRKELGNGAVEFAAQGKAFAISMVVRPDPARLQAIAMPAYTASIPADFYLNRLAPTKPL